MPHASAYMDGQSAQAAEGITGAEGNGG